MSILELIRNDIKKITSNLNDFGVIINFTAPDGNSVDVPGTAKKHHLQFDDTGTAVSVKTASCSISESVLREAGYTVRNAGNEVALKGHKVTWSDSSNSEWTYVIRETYPDETLGLIVCILSDFK